MTNTRMLTGVYHFEVIDETKWNERSRVGRGVVCGGWGYTRRQLFIIVGGMTEWKDRRFGGSFKRVMKGLVYLETGYVDSSQRKHEEMPYAAWINGKRVGWNSEYKGAQEMADRIWRKLLEEELERIKSEDDRQQQANP